MANSHSKPRKNRRASASKRAHPRHNPHTGHSGQGRRSRRHNPGFALAHRRRRNPSRVRDFSGLNKPVDWLWLAGGAAVGALAPGYVGNMILGANNTGALGYAIEAGTSVIGGLLVGKYFNRAAGAGLIAGGLGGVIIRIFQENTATHPVAMAQATGQTAGNSNAAATGVGMGSYWPFEYQYPTTKQWIGGQLIDGPRLNIPPYPDARAALPPGSAAAGSGPAIGTGPELARYSR